MSGAQRHLLCCRAGRGELRRKELISAGSKQIDSGRTRFAPSQALGWPLPVLINSPPLFDRGRRADPEPEARGLGRMQPEAANFLSC